MYCKIVRRFYVIAALLAFSAAFAFAQDAKVKIKVEPDQAYIFVDGQPFAHRSQTISLPAGEHTIGIYNYGFVPQVKVFTLAPGHNPTIDARLEKVPAMVNGPWGRIQIEGNVDDKAAVFINGIKPEYFVGHIDEMNHAALVSQKLVLPVGTYQLILVNPKETQPFFNDKVEVRNNERVVVNVTKNTRDYEPWKHVGVKESRHRFKAGISNSAIVVAPVTATFTVDKFDIKCGEPVQLSWTSTEAVDTTIASSPVVEVQPTGQRTDNPLKTTFYTFQAKGPGGIVTQTATVHVDPTVQTAMTANPQEVHYRRIDDKVIDPGTTNLKWSADNAHNASIDPLGTVPTYGEKAVPAAPKKTDVGTVDEMATYQLMATNNCGGMDKSLAAVHITGTIEPLPVVTLASIFFPTAYPTAQHPEIGLLTGEKEVLAEAVAGYKKFLEYDPETRLKIISNADPRATDDYNMKLSERRAQIVKDTLVALGVEEAKIEILAQGETQQLDKAAVENLEQINERHRPITTELVLAYNRRADLVMIPKVKPEQQSKQTFPHEIKDAKLLQSSTFHGLRTVEKASAPTGAAAAAGQQ